MREIEKNKYVSKMGKEAEAKLPIAVDLDKTLAEGIWPTPGIGEPIDGAQKYLQKLKEDGNNIVVHTSRPWGDREAILEYLLDHGIEVDGVVCGKLLAKLYLDDKALNFTDWETSYFKIRRFLNGK